MCDVNLMQGEEAAFFYVVSEGQFGVVLTSGGRETIIHTYSAGDHANCSFGELALASGRPHAAKVVAKTDGKVLHLLWAVAICSGVAVALCQMMHSKHQNVTC